jgi:hypothetical protein
MIFNKLKKPTRPHKNVMHIVFLLREDIQMQNRYYMEKPPGIDHAPDFGKYLESGNQWFVPPPRAKTNYQL